MENLCRERALQAYRLDPEKWGINVQPYRSVPPATSMHDPSAVLTCVVVVVWPALVCVVQW